MTKVIGGACHTIRLCIAGATGRMGSTVVEEAAIRGFKIVGAVATSSNASIGKSLKDVGVCNSDVSIVNSSRLREAVEDADVYVTFTAPEAELANLPIVAEMGKRIVMGTTGFTNEQERALRRAIEVKVPAVFSANFAPGANIFLQLIRTLALLPSDYDFTVTEMHHTGKKDAPSGTAKKIGELVAQARGYDSIVYGRQGVSPRSPGQLEVLSARAGGIPGIHDLVIAGPHEMIRVEHLAFSRSVFAQGALYAAEWIYRLDTPGIYTMNDVFSERQK